LNIGGSAGHVLFLEAQRAKWENVTREAAQGVAMNVPLRRGSLLRYQGRYWFVDNVAERHSGKQRPVVHVALHGALEAQHIERTLDELMPIEEVACTYRPMQYLYAKGKAHLFMDSQSFEEIELAEAALHGCEPFLKEGEEFRVLYAGEQPLRLEIPESVAVRIADTAAPAHAVGAAGSVLKDAKLENGLTIHVPLFIKTGDVIRVDTRSRQYLGKA